MLGDSVVDIIGNTPVVRLHNYEKKNGVQANLYAKLEYFNPTGSAKDRAALFMIEDAEAKGLLFDDSVIIEPTSGNTGIGLCSIAASKGYKCIIVMPDTMSIERQKLMRAFGAEVVLTPGAEGMNGAIAKADELAKEYPHSFIPQQFENKANAYAHYMTTGRELYEDLDGNIDIFVCTVGTGGTISGTGIYLKEKDPSIKVIAVEPKGSPFLSEGKSGPHKIQGLGAGFIPGVLDTNIYDEVIAVEDDDAYDRTRNIARCEGLLVGISSGAALWAAELVASREENKGKNIAVLLPDTGERYLSTEGLFD